MSEATSYLAETAPQTGPPVSTVPVATPNAAQPGVTATTNTATPELSGDEAHLQSIFPDLDVATIHDCYVLCDRNVERTVEFLLGDASTTAAGAQSGMSQTDIDEQLARHLEEEELSAAVERTNRTARAWVPDQQQQQQQQFYPQAPGQYPVGAARQPNSQGGPSDGPDFQEQFNKIAETGKRTFNSIFNKVKEKFKEFDQPAPASSSQPYYAPEHSQGPAMAQQPQAAPAPRPYEPRHAHAPPAGPPPVTAPAPAPVHQEERVTTESSAIPSNSTPASATTAAAPTPPIDVSKAAFLAKKPTPLTETSKPTPDEDLTENPFDDRRD